MKTLLPIIFLVNTVQLLGGIISANNVIHTDDNGDSYGQIEVDDENTTLLLGNFGGSGWSDYAKNNFTGATPNIYCSTNLDLGNIDNNYWDGSDAVVSAGITFSPNPSAYRTTPTSAGSVSCNSSLHIKQKDNNVFLVNTLFEDDSCAYLKKWNYIDAFTKEKAKEKYDTLRLFIEKCAISDNESWRVFTSIDGAVGRYSSDTTRFETYRTWLISVLYLNTTNAKYFCRCLSSIASTFPYGKYYPLGSFAVNNYLRNHRPDCWESSDSAEYARDSIEAVRLGYDVNHLPPLDSLGLGFLLESGIVPSTSLSSTYLVSFTSSPNPFKDETRLHFHLNRTSHVSIQISDLLGKVLWETKGRTYEEGDHDIGINGKSLPDGTLYARISTGFGEVKTVKLIKTTE